MYEVVIDFGVYTHDEDKFYCPSWWNLEETFLKAVEKARKYCAAHRGDPDWGECYGVYAVNRFTGQVVLTCY